MCTVIQMFFYTIMKLVITLPENVNKSRISAGRLSLKLHWCYSHPRTDIVQNKQQNLYAFFSYFTSWHFTHVLQIRLCLWVYGQIIIMVHDWAMQFSYYYWCCNCICHGCVLTRTVPLWVDDTGVFACLKSTVCCGFDLSWQGVLLYRVDSKRVRWLKVYAVWSFWRANRKLELAKY
jgi:hypothetical protein